MRVVIVGLGVQGMKRRKVAGDDVAFTVDPVSPEADFESLEQVPTETYDAALVCTPDDANLAVVSYLIEHGKHLLVEKPFLVDQAPETLAALQSSALDRGLHCYTAYNHRFEPHLVELQGLLRQGTLGEVYRIRLSYGNGTARDVKASPWRDAGAGVLVDLGSHLLDLVLFLFGEIPDDLSIWSANRFETAAPDHVLFGSRSHPLLEMSVSLVSWRNDFVAEIAGSRGSARVSSLCKWGPSTLTTHTRVLPSGRPPEISKTLISDDPTWEAEYEAFKQNCEARAPGNFANDILIGQSLQNLSSQIKAKHLV